MKNHVTIKSIVFYKVILLLVPLLGVSTFIKAQFFDELSNPKVTVNIIHPPALGLKVNKIAFNPAFGNCSEQVIDALIQDFVNSKVDVIDRANLNAILAEHNLNSSGYIDKINAVAIGKILGPSALITVNVLRCETQKKQEKGTEKRHNYQINQDYYVNWYQATTTVYFKASIQTTDLTTGRIFSAQNFEYSPAFYNKSYDGMPEAPSEFEIQAKAFSSLVWDVHKLFFSWTEPTVLYYFDDKDGGLKQAFQALKAGAIDQAYKLSIQNLETCKKTPNIKPKLLAHAYYNAGMSYMINNEYDKAVENFQESQLLRPGNIVANALSDCTKAKKLSTEMQKIDEKAAVEAQKVQTETENAIKAQENST
ncbi:MAG: CsgG/HfaB family protein, partial [Paludibacter sp.]